ncbi:MAG: hypothetical protein L6R42_004211 [Xanthoria sp. 1 TBL-2021]|nr:MAG: hypothetical protein L6R42_004211 [Xanthoria sp. 1 TBL-2021]
MAPFNWPRPPNLDGLSTDEAVSATQRYVNHVQTHMGGLQLNSTEYGVLIGFMFSALGDATKIFDVVYQESATSPDVRHDISRFRLAMESLTRYMENPSIILRPHGPASEAASCQLEGITQIEDSDVSEAADPADSSTKAIPAVTEHRHEKTPIKWDEEQTVQINICSTDPDIPALEDMSGDQLRYRLVEDFQDQGIRLPLLSCWTSPGSHHVFLLTSSKYYAAILRDENFWKPTLFGANSRVVDPRSGQDTPGMSIVSSLLDQPKMRKAETRARGNARLFWIDITDRRFAKQELLPMDNSQLEALIEQDLQAQQIMLPFRKCKKSGACNHIRVWTYSAKDVRTFVNQWKPTLFGTGAFLRWQKKRDVAGPAVTISQRQVHDEDAKLSSGLSEAPFLTSREARKVRQVLREVFIEIPDQLYAKTNLFGLKTAKLKALIRHDLESQDMDVRIAGCKLFRAGAARLRLRTKTPEEAECLKTPGTWVPMAFGQGAYVVTV